MSAAEEEKLVENFSELGPGKLVVYRPCQWCGARHRTQLGNFVQGTIGFNPGGDVVPFEGFKVFVQPPCTALPFLVTPAAVEQKLVYLIVDPLLAPGAQRRKARSRDDLVDADRRR